MCKEKKINIFIKHVLIYFKDSLCQCVSIILHVLFLHSYYKDLIFIINVEFSYIYCDNWKCDLECALELPKNKITRMTIKIKFPSARVKIVLLKSNFSSLNYIEH